MFHPLGHLHSFNIHTLFRWGIADIEDCCSGAQFLADEGKADSGKLLIDGGSAGGFAALAALTFHKVFSAGTSFYGVSDLEALAKDTHKFESRYLDTLIGPYPEDKKIYEERSPIHYTEQLDCALCIFQGSEDKVGKYYFVRSLSSFLEGYIQSFYN